MKKKINKQMNPICPICGQEMLQDVLNTYICLSCELDREEKEELKKVDEEYKHWG